MNTPHIRSVESIVPCLFHTPIGCISQREKHRGDLTSSIYLFVQVKEQTEKQQGLRRRHR